MTGLGPKALAPSELLDARFSCSIPRFARASLGCASLRARPEAALAASASVDRLRECETPGAWGQLFDPALRAGFARLRRVPDGPEGP